MENGQRGLLRNKRGYASDYLVRGLYVVDRARRSVTSRSVVRGDPSFTGTAWVVTYRSS